MPERVADLLAGGGAGYALAAGLTSHHGPRHVLDLAAGLALTPEQNRAAGEAYAAMEVEAKQLGEQLGAREAALDRAFAGGAATADEIARLAGGAAAAEGRLRAVHLRAHLATKAIVTPEEVARYDRLAATPATPRPAAGATAPAGTGRPKPGPTEQKGVPMAAPFILNNTHAIREGRHEAFRGFLREFFTILEANEPRARHQRLRREDGTETTIVQLHPDAASMEHPHRVAHEHTAGACELLEVSTSIQVYGRPSDPILERTRRPAAAGVRVSVRPEHLGGFTRLPAAPAEPVLRVPAKRAAQGQRHEPMRGGTR